MSVPSLEPGRPADESTQVGETKASFPKNYAQQLVDLVNQINPALLAIVNDQYAPAKTWNDAFFGTPQGRFDLAKLARFGDLTEQLIDVIRSQLVQWLQVCPTTGPFELHNRSLQLMS